MFDIFIMLIGLLVLAAIVMLGIFALIKVLQMIFPDLFGNNKVGTIATWLRESMVPRFLLVGALTVLMVLPLSMLRGVVDERSDRHVEVLRGIAQEWGGRQLLAGPVLVIPFTQEYVEQETIADDEGNEKVVTKRYEYNKHMLVLPERADIDISIEDDTLNRGIYDSLVYRSDMRIEGEFVLPDLQKMAENIKTIHLNNAFVAVSLSDIQAINRIDDLQWGGANYSFDSGVNVDIEVKPNWRVAASTRSIKSVDVEASSESDGRSSGFHANVSQLRSGGKYPYVINMSTNGSYGVRFAPFGRVTSTNIHSPWPHPSFQGARLPDTRTITTEGFSASWEIPSITRNFPQSLVLEDGNYNFGELITGVDLVEPVDLYSKVDRAVKYGLLFISLTFLTFLVFELGSKSRRLHIIQYALIGGTLGLFYLCLLSLSEHRDFLESYLISAAVIIGLISLYTLIAARSLLRAIVVGLMLSALYAVLYALLNLEDYALLVGTGLLIFVMAVLMVITRNLANGTKTETIPPRTDVPKPALEPTSTPTNSVN